MENSPRGKSGRQKGEKYAHPVDLEEAKQIAGSWEALKKGHKKETANGWTKGEKKVPADVVIKFLLPWWRARKDLVAQIRAEERARHAADLRHRADAIEGIPPKEPDDLAQRG